MLKSAIPFVQISFGLFDHFHHGNFATNEVFSKGSALGYQGDKDVSEEHAWDEICDVWRIKEKSNITWEQNITSSGTGWYVVNFYLNI